MIKQVKILTSAMEGDLEREVNRFCMDFFPEEIFSIQIIPPTNKHDWCAVIEYQKDEYAEDE